jgi:hypothetical protein
MEPIISPWLVYFISISTSIKAVFAIIAIISLAIAFFIILYNFIEEDSMDRLYDSKTKKLDSSFKKLIAFIIFSSILATFIPTKETIIAMYIANMITLDNLNLANEVFKSNLKDYLDIITNSLNK